MLGGEETNGSSSELEDQVVKDLVVVKPKVNKKARNYSSSEKHAYKEMNHILENYLLKYQNKDVQSKIDNQFKNFSVEKKKVQGDREVYMKQRQSFMATKVNLQEIALQDHLFSSMSTFYGLASDKPTPLQPASSSTLRSSSNQSAFLN